MDDEVFYPVDEAAEILKPTPGRIRQMLREGSPEGLPPEESGRLGEDYYGEAPAARNTGKCQSLPGLLSVLESHEDGF